MRLGRPARVFALGLTFVVVSDCAANLRNRVVVDGRTAFAPENERAIDYTGSEPYEHRGMEREIVDSLVRLSPTPLEPDGLLHALGETLFYEFGRESDSPPSEVRQFALRWNGIAEMDVAVGAFEHRSTELADFAVRRIQRSLSNLSENELAFNRIAVVVDTAPGGVPKQKRALVLLSARYFDLDPTPQRVALGAPLRLRGRLLDPFDHPTVVITRADGRSERRPVGLSREIDVELPTDEPGALQVEIMGSYRFGPRPLANFPIWVARTPPGYVFLEDEQGGTTSRDVVSETLELVNESRAEHGLGPLELDLVLGRVARRYCEEMRQHDFHGHVSPWSGTPQDRAERGGYQGSVGENIASGFRTALDAHRGLMGSPGHAANILDPDATHLGIGVIGYGPGDDRRYVMTELFGHLSGWSAWSLEQRVSRLADMAARELGIDPARVDALASSPPPRRAYSAREVQALLALALAETSRGHLARALAIAQRARAPAATAPLRMEIARRSAADPAAARAAVVGILRELPPGTVDRPLLRVRRNPTAADMDGELHSLQREPLSLDVLLAAIEIPVLWKPMRENRDLHEAALAEARAEIQSSLASRRHSFPALELARGTAASKIVVAIWARAVHAESFPGRIAGVVAQDSASGADAFGSEARGAARHESHLVGTIDSSCGFWTPDAERTWNCRRASRGAKREAFDRILRDVAGWGLGTHDASVLLGGNPFARLAVFRGPWLPSVTEAAQTAERLHFAAIADFVRQNHVRVVLAGTQSLEEVAEDLREGNDLSSSEGAIEARARQLLERTRDRWRGLLGLCPDTLFVVPNGSGWDDAEVGDVPASLDAPNLLVVGALDEFGYPTSCPGASGPHVDVYDLGVGVAGLLPSGRRVALPGTGRAAARVASLAAKLVALDPRLTPGQVIAAIVETGDPVAARHDSRIANATQAAARVRQGRPPAR